MIEFWPTVSVRTRIVESETLPREIGDGGDASGANADSIFEFVDLSSVGSAGGVADDDTEFWVGVTPTRYDSLYGERPVRVYTNGKDGSPQNDDGYYSLNGDYPGSVSADIGQPEKDLIDLTPGEFFDDRSPESYGRCGRRRLVEPLCEREGLRARQH